MRGTDSDGPVKNSFRIKLISLFLSHSDFWSFSFSCEITAMFYKSNAVLSPPEAKLSAPPPEQYVINIIFIYNANIKTIHR